MENEFFIKEKSHECESICELQEVLARRNVQETASFRLKDMVLCSNGILRVHWNSGHEDFRLNQVSVENAVQRGGMTMCCFENFLGNDDLIVAITHAISEHYKKCQDADSRVKLVVRNGLQDAYEKVVLGIVSERYRLYTNEQALEDVSSSVSTGNLQVKRVRMSPEFMEVSYTNPLDVVRDKVGEIVEVGMSYMNSEGSRKSTLSMCGFLFRLACLNGSTSAISAYKKNYVHVGYMGGLLDNRGEAERILANLRSLASRIPMLGAISSMAGLSIVEPAIVATIGKKRFHEDVLPLFGRDGSTATAHHLWNYVTDLPKKTASPIARLKLEQAGFALLEHCLN